MFTSFQERESQTEKLTTSHQKSFPCMWENLKEQIAVNQTTASTRWHNSSKCHLQILGKAHFLLLFEKSTCLSVSQSSATPFASSKRCFGLAVAKQKWLQMKILALALPQQGLFNTTPRFFASSIGKEKRIGQFPGETMTTKTKRGKKWYRGRFSNYLLSPQRTNDRCSHR